MIEGIFDMEQIEVFRMNIILTYVSLKNKKKQIPLRKLSGFK